MVQEPKLWYDYIIMVRSGNAELLIVICCIFVMEVFSTRFHLQFIFPINSFRKEHIILKCV